MAKVITIAQQKGGAGKTTLAAQLALAWHGLGLRVTLIDVDPQGSLARWFELRERTLGAGGAGIGFVAVSGWRATAEIERHQREADLIIVDSAPHAQTDAKLAIRAAHLVIVPVQPSPLDLWATRPTLELAAEARRPVLLALNRVPARSTIAETMAAEAAALGAGLAAARLGNRAGFAASMAAGLTVMETAPSSVAAREVRALADEILVKAG
ncbi:MAG TPA: ParA family partition ATPase [Aliidongia sp.]|nr:ParA family partition ATPase [Aliidongia sp.]